jgi:[ribosomal protein S18]-alanine N-acetyltransferase
MSEPVHLAPGSAMPLWVETLEQAAFEGSWGPLQSHEHLFGYPPHAYIRWSVIPAAHEAELLRIAVSTEAQRQGLARKLLEKSETFLRGEGIDTLHLEVRSSNQPARALYEAMGWTFQRTRKAYYRDGEDALIFRKQLEP